MSFTNREVIARFIEGKTGVGNGVTSMKDIDGNLHLITTRYGDQTIAVKLKTKKKNVAKVEYIINGDGTMSQNYQFDMRSMLDNIALGIPIRDSYYSNSAQRRKEQLFGDDRDEWSAGLDEYMRTRKRYVTIPFSAMLREIPMDDIEKIRVIDFLDDRTEYYDMVDSDGNPILTERNMWNDETQKYETRMVQKQGVLHELGGVLYALGKKYYLSGIDNSGKGWGISFFIVRLPEKAESIADAYELLKPPQLRDGWVEMPRERKPVYGRKEYARQGEYFFVPTDYKTKDIIKMGVAKRLPKTMRDIEQTITDRYGQRTLRTRKGYMTREKNGMLKMAEINRFHRVGGNAHKVRDAFYTQDGKIFVRGTVFHPEHTRYSCRETWHEVFINTAKGSWSADGGRVD